MAAVVALIRSQTGSGVGAIHCAKVIARATLVAIQVAVRVMPIVYA